MKELLLYIYKDLLLIICLAAAISILFFRLTKRLAASENEKKALQGLVTSLLNKYSNRDSLLAQYIYDTNLGIYKHKSSGQYFCHKCLIERTNESPLEERVGGWSCPVCGSFYRKPDDKSSPS